MSPENIPYLMGNLQLRKPLNQQGQWKAQSAKTPQRQQRQIKRQGTTGSGKATNPVDPDAEMRRVATGITRLKLAKTRISGAQKGQWKAQSAKTPQRQQRQINKGQRVVAKLQTQ
ncbi:hypothetical protein QE152_g39350 [Popillia japonica]|uniref:Uncharacterized protein n=1 Tax=Popillia japonica TaxID=7064 RepID=A0AAW1HTZ9_POPJA